MLCYQLPATATLHGTLICRGMPLRRSVLSAGSFPLTRHRPAQQILKLKRQIQHPIPACTIQHEKEGPKAGLGYALSCAPLGRAL